MDALIEFAEHSRLDLKDIEPEQDTQPDRSVVGMDKIWYNCTDDYLD